MAPPFISLRMLQAAGVGGGFSTEISYGTPGTFNSSESSYTSVAVDPNDSNKFVVAYKDDGNSNYGTVVIGTISGTTISFGSEYIFLSGRALAVFVDYSPHVSNQILISYSDSAAGWYGKAIVGTVSGTSVSFGTSYTYQSNSSGGGNHYYDPHTSGKFALTSYKVDGWYRSSVWIGSISGTTISFGSPTVAYSDNVSAYNSKLSFDPNNSGKVALFSGFGSKVYIGTISGSSSSLGAGYTVESGYNFNANPEILYDKTPGSNKLVCAWKSGNTNAMKCSLGTVSGTSISFETPTVFNSSYITSGPIKGDMSALTDGRFVLSTRGSSSDQLTTIIGHIDGTSIEFGDFHEVATSSTLEFAQPRFNPSDENKIIVGYRSGNYGKAAVMTIS
jgi:hypothetical protein